MCFFANLQMRHVSQDVRMFLPVADVWIAWKNFRWLLPARILSVILSS
jgi:hypothetical protein